MTDAAPPPVSQELAGPGARFVAALIDGVLSGIASAIPAIGIVIAIVYSLVKDALPFLDGQSIGKRAMGIRAVKLAGGEPLTDDYVTAIVRQISLWIPFFNVVDACMVFSEGRQRFGDRWAKTIVIVAK